MVPPINYPEGSTLFIFGHMSGNSSGVARVVSHQMSFKGGYQPTFRLDLSGQTR